MPTHGSLSKAGKVRMQTPKIEKRTKKVLLAQRLVTTTCIISELFWEEKSVSLYMMADGLDTHLIPALKIVFQ